MIGVHNPCISGWLRHYCKVQDMYKTKVPEFERRLKQIRNAPDKYRRQALRFGIAPGSRHVFIEDKNGRAKGVLVMSLSGVMLQTVWLAYCHPEIFNRRDAEQVPVPEPKQMKEELLQVIDDGIFANLLLQDNKQGVKIGALRRSSASRGA